MGQRKVFNEQKSRVMKIARRGAIINQHAPVISNKRKEGLEKLKNMSDEEITDITNELMEDFSKEEIEQAERDKLYDRKLVQMDEELKLPCHICGAAIGEFCDSTYHM